MNHEIGLWELKRRKDDRNLHSCWKEIVAGSIGDRGHGVTGDWGLSHGSVGWP